MWFNYETIPQASQSYLEVFRQFGVLDLQWILGSMPCGLESAFCHHLHSSLMWSGMFTAGGQTEV